MGERTCCGLPHRSHQALPFCVALPHREVRLLHSFAAGSVPWLQVHTSIVAPVPSCVAWLHRELVFVGTWQGSSQLLHIRRHKVRGHCLQLYQQTERECYSPAAHLE